MKKITLVLVLTVLCFSTYAQVGIGNTNPDPSSILELTSTTQGLLTPRMSQSERDAIVTPATGLLIYQTDNAYGFYYYDGSSWKSFGGSGTDSDWIINGNEMYNANTGNIGVGNIAPSTKFHITGTTTPGSPGSTGGSTILYSNNFESGTVNYITGGSNSCTTGSEVWDITTSEPILVSCTNCSGSFAAIEYSTSCVQDQTLLEGAFVPTKNNIDISFNYGYYSGFSNPSSFVITLFNNTTSSVEHTLVNSTTTLNDQTFTTNKSVTIGDNYTLRIQYTGNDDFGALIDDIVITELGTSSPPVSGSYVFRLEDGQEHAGYVLTSDANGNATWKPSGGSASAQTLSMVGNNLTILGGNTVTLPSGGSGSGTDDQVIDVFSLSGNTLSLSLENDSEATKTVDLSSVLSGTYTFTNGINESGGTVKLGGTLTENSIINLDDNDLTFTTSSTSAFPGDIIFEGSDREAMSTNLDKNYVGFGGSSYISTDGTSVDNTTFTDSGSNSYTIDVGLGVHTGGSGGSGFKMGSIEYIWDGLGELFVNSDFSPYGSFISSGTASHMWSSVYSTNGTIQTSDINLKKNIKTLDYGLSEIMKLKTITYNWKNNTKGKTKIPENLQERKIGFSAQQLLEILPETVNTHSWVAADEKGNYRRKKNENLGVYYSDIIPVAVKAIQEQQYEIENLRVKMKKLESIVQEFILDKK
tara:strand:- start:2210 stop:4303 length:2094 start_codon:yes stop_codon:yes gene_type:complete